MIDAWEILGRVLTNDAYRARVYKCAPNKPDINKATRACFAGNDYETLRKTVQTAVDGPISLAGLGEILWGLTSSDFRDKIETLAGQIKKTGVNTSGRNYYFYVALAAMVTDSNLRAKLISNPPYKNFDTYGFKKLSQRDRRALIKVFTRPKPSQGPGAETAVVMASEDVCESLWSTDCFLKTVFWAYPGPRPHTHPVPLSGPPRDSK